MTAYITAIGTATPPYTVRQQEAASFMGSVLQMDEQEQRILNKIYKNSGIEQRYSCISDYTKTQDSFEFFPKDLNGLFPSTIKRMNGYRHAAPELAKTAIKNCIKNKNNFSIQQITHLITVSCTGMYAPGLDIDIVRMFNLNSHVKRTCINFMGCYGAFNAIKVADAICKADQNACVLILCLELCTLHVQKNKSINNLISSAIFADGAAAIMVEPQPQPGKNFRLEHFFCDIHFDDGQQMAWEIGNHGFDMALTAYVPVLIKSGISALTQNLLAQSKINLEQINYFAIHPGGKKILQACEQALDITEHHNRFSYNVLANYGNMSSCTVLFVFHEIWQALQNNDHEQPIISFAFGPGLTMESMLLKVNLY